MKGPYIFKSERLGFRNWIPADIEKMIRINADREVMKYFPAQPSKEQKFYKSHGKDRNVFCQKL